MKILFVGNSHTYYNDMPHTVAELYRVSGLEVPDVTMLAIPGESLAYHRDQPQLRFALKYGNFNRVIFQDRGQPFMGYEQLNDDVDKIIPLVDREKTKICLYMTWASLEAPEEQAEAIRSYTDASKKHSTDLAPVGKIWAIVKNERPEINLFYEDGCHAGIYGSFLVACTIFKAITGLKKINPDINDSFFDCFDREQLKILMEYVNKYA